MTEEDGMTSQWVGKKVVLILNFKVNEIGDDYFPIIKIDVIDRYLSSAGSLRDGKFEESIKDGF